MTALKFEGKPPKNHKAKAQQPVSGAVSMEALAVAIEQQPAPAPLVEPQKVEAPATPTELPPAPQLEPVDPLKVLEGATPLGKEAYFAIMDSAETQAEELRKTGITATKVADQFKQHCLTTAHERCDPVVQAAMEFQMLCNDTAEKMLAEARKQAESAVSFTKKLRDLGDVVKKTANGDEDADKKDT